MRKIAFVSATLALAAFQAHAVDGTITFTGTLQTTTCSPTINGGGASQTVTLPTLATSAFTGAGSEAGLTPFTVSIGGAGCNMSNAVTGFEPTPGSLSGTDLTAGATGAVLTLRNSSNGVIDLSKGSGAQNAGTIALTGAANSKTGTGTYYVSYKQPTATALTAGAVSATLNYTMSYN